MIELMPKWYQLNEEDEIPYVYIWRCAELGKLAYNLKKYKKACENTEKAY
jgi:ribosomal protein L7Ae-like RNA K-turn-binding protein